MTAYESRWFENFQRVIQENSDLRTQDWPLIGNPSVLLITIVAYLYFVCIYGPNYMKNRKPYDLKKVITVYNAGQIAACFYIFYGVLTSGWLDEYSLGCQPVDKSDSPRALRMASFVWWTFMLKLVEFLETVFFVLRKKENQISGLHVYHHVSTALIGWACCKFTPGGMATLPILVNCMVHIPMYTYYLVALHGGRDLQRKLQGVKKAITIMQMVQFSILLAHASIALRSDCPVTNIFVYIFVPDIIVLYYMFYKFYKTAYNKAK